MPVNNFEQKDFLNSLFSSSSPNSMGLLPMDNHNSTATSIPSPLFPTPNDQSTSFYPHQRNSSQQFDPGQNQLFDEFLTPPSSSSSSSYLPVQNNNNNNHSYMNVTYQGPTHDSTSFTNHHHPYPY